MVRLVVKVPQTDDEGVLKSVEKMDGFYRENLRRHSKF